MLILLPPSEKKASSPGPAIELYTGVLYAALGWSGLTQAQQERAGRSVVIISAKYGAIWPHEFISPYKEKIDTALMRPKVTQLLDRIDCKLVVDCRSSTYQGVWRSPIEKTVEIKVFTTVDGVIKVITHMSKKTRGEVAHLLLSSSEFPTNPHELKELVSQKFVCVLQENTADQPWVLEVYC